MHTGMSAKSTNIMASTTVFAPAGNGIMRHERHMTYPKARNGRTKVMILKIFNPGIIMFCGEISKINRTAAACNRL